MPSWKERIMETLDILLSSTLYCRHKNPAQFLGRVETLMETYDDYLRLLILNSSSDVFQELKHAKGEYKFEEIAYSRDILAGNLCRVYGRHEKRKLEGKLTLFKSNHAEVYVVITHERRKIFEECIFRFFSSKYPKISLPFFYSWQMKYFLDQLQKGSPNDKIIVTASLRKSRIENPQARKFKETDKTWTDLPYEEFFEQTKQRSEWVDKVYFDLISEKRVTTKGMISRDGKFAWLGQFTLFHQIILEQAVQASAKNHEKLNKRSRNEQPGFKAKPIFIEYDVSIFADKEQNKNLIRALKKLPHSANSVIHENPYLHMTLTDYLDGSSCDIWVLSNNKISIIPQTICSASSLNRICSSIFRDFMEGNIKDPSEVEI